MFELKRKFRYRDFRFVPILAIAFITSLVMYFERPSVKTIADLETIEGKLVQISIVRGNLYKNREKYDDLKYLIFLDTYPCYFIARGNFDENIFYTNSKPGDLVKLMIPKEEIKNLNISNTGIASLSLQVNETEYVKHEEGILSFGHGIFELLACIFSFSFLIFAIAINFRRKK